MKKTIEDIAAFFFIGAVVVLSVISIFGVWDFFEKDVVTKSFLTIGLLAGVSVIVMIAARYVGDGSLNISYVPNPIFRGFRYISIGVLIVSTSLLAIIGVLAIWDFFEEKEILYKSIGTIAILVFSNLIVVGTCLHREKNSALTSEVHPSLSPGRMILWLIALAIFLPFLWGLFSALY